MSERKTCRDCRWFAVRPLSGGGFCDHPESCSTRPDGSAVDMRTGPDDSACKQHEVAE